LNKPITLKKVLSTEKKRNYEHLSLSIRRA
jgi:hypothetical protein